MTLLSSHREWLATVAALPESDLPCNVSTVAYAIQVAAAAVEAHDALLAVVDQLTRSLDNEREALRLTIDEGIPAW